MINSSYSELSLVSSGLILSWRLSRVAQYLHVSWIFLVPLILACTDLVFPYNLAFFAIGSPLMWADVMCCDYNTRIMRFTSKLFCQSLAWWIIVCWYIHWSAHLLREQEHTSVPMMKAAFFNFSWFVTNESYCPTRIYLRLKSCLWFSTLHANHH